MNVPAHWQNPINVPPGQFQTDVNPLLLLPSRSDLLQVRVDMQQALLDAGTERSTPIQVTPDGVIWDGHHAVRAAAQDSTLITVKVVKASVKPTATSIMDLTVS